MHEKIVGVTVQGIGTIKELFWKRDQEKGKETEGVSFKELEVTVKNLGIYIKKMYWKRQRKKSNHLKNHRVKTILE